MNKARATAWVQALRSGRYPQGNGALKRDGSYCCLGVLCQTLEEEGVLKSRPIGERNTTWGLSSGGFLPGEDVARLLEVGDSNIEITYEGQQVELWRLNDVYGLSFVEIADLIEEEYLK